MLYFFTLTLLDSKANSPCHHYKLQSQNKVKMEPLKKAQHNKNKNVAGSICLSLFMNRSGKWKLPSMPPSTGISRIQHLNNYVFVNFEF